MKSEEKEAKEAEKASVSWVFVEVTGVIIAYLAILAALLFPLWSSGIP